MSVAARAATGRRLRAALLACDGFAALAAVGGGLALALGLEGDRFPTSWLEGTPFRDYVVPGLILAGVVGGTATVATLAMARTPRVGGAASVAAGLVMVGWIAGEVVLLREDGELVSSTEAVFGALGLAMVGLGWAVSHR